MKNYEQNVTMTIFEDEDDEFAGVYRIWLDDEDGLHVTRRRKDIIIPYKSVYWYKILKKYKKEIINFL